MDLQMIKVGERSKVMNAEAFTKLYQENYNYLYKYALKLTKNIDDAQDLLQDTYEKVYFSKKHSINEKNFKYYMKAALLNQFKKFYKKKKRDSEVFDVYTSPDEIPTFMAEPEEFDKLVSFLSEKEQKMYDLRYKMGYSEKQIADILGMKDSTVRSIFHRTNQKLREMLKKLGIAMFILCAFISVTVAAVSLINYIQDMFRVKNNDLENTAVLEAIANNNWFQKCDMDYVDVGNGYKVKLDYFVLDEMSLYLVFDLESEKNLSKYNEFSILDLKIENENGELIYTEDSFDENQFRKLKGWKTISVDKNHIKQLLYMYTYSFPTSNNLNITFSKIGLHKNLLFDKNIDTINASFDFSLNLSEKFKNRNYTSYASDSENLQKAIISETGFYAILNLDYVHEISAKLIDNNGVEYNCFAPHLNSYGKDNLINEFIIVSNYNNKNAKNLKLIIDGIEYKLENQP